MLYNTILFDLDGTLTDPAKGITGGVAHALDYFGNKYKSRKSLEIFIGPPLREQFMEYCNVDREKGEEYVAKYREYYAVTGIYEIIPGFICGAIAAVVVSLIDKAPSEEVLKLFEEGKKITE